MTLDWFPPLIFWGRVRRDDEDRKGDDSNEAHCSRKRIDIDVVESTEQVAQGPLVLAHKNVSRGREHENICYFLQRDTRDTPNLPRVM